MEKTNKDFREITGHRISNTSLLNQFNILKDSNEENYLLNIWKGYFVVEEIKNNEDYISHYDVPGNSFWENISYEAYENENLWWMVAMSNDVINPFEELTPGDRIKVIDRNLLYEIVKEVKNISEL